MLPDSHQPARLYGTAKTHKFENYDEIKMYNLKASTIMGQPGPMVCSASQVIAEYLSPLAENKYVLKDCLSFPKIFSKNKKNEDEEDISHVVSIFKNAPINETINRIKTICRKLIMKRFLVKLTTDFLFTLNNTLYKQINCCLMEKSSASCPCKYLYGKIGKIHS